MEAIMDESILVIPEKPQKQQEHTPQEKDMNDGEKDNESFEQVSYDAKNNLCLSARMTSEEEPETIVPVMRKKMEQQQQQNEGERDRSESVCVTTRDSMVFEHDLNTEMIKTSTEGQPSPLGEPREEDIPVVLEDGTQFARESKTENQGHGVDETFGVELSSQHWSIEKEMSTGKPTDEDLAKIFINQEDSHIPNEFVLVDEVKKPQRREMEMQETIAQSYDPKMEEQINQLNMQESQCIAEIEKYESENIGQHNGENHKELIHDWQMPGADGQDKLISKIHTNHQQAKTAQAEHHEENDERNHQIKWQETTATMLLSEPHGFNEHQYGEPDDSERVEPVLDNVQSH
ncbi:unnamed protein product, partial [Echinostoma caproni]|uniref:Uncharacterized protein n=1 Tax=Echinostoma caproni TaxID=27848 RepID=A0A183APE9_9TREM